jgi:hypothetical protein
METLIRQRSRSSQAVEDSSHSVEDRPEHRLVTGHLKHEFLSELWNFAEAEESPFADPVEEEHLQEGENGHQGLQLTEEASMENVADDENISLSDVKFGRLIQLVDPPHQPRAFRSNQTTSESGPDEVVAQRTHLETQPQQQG